MDVVHQNRREKKGYPKSYVRKERAGSDGAGNGGEYVALTLLRPAKGEIRSKESEVCDSSPRSARSRGDREYWFRVSVLRNRTVYKWTAAKESVGAEPIVQQEHM